MITREQKKAIIEELTVKLDKAVGIYLVDFTGMSVAMTYEFRKVVRAEKLEYKVAKNTLITKAMEQVEGRSLPDEALAGQTGMILGYDDPSSPAKVLKKFIKDNEKPIFKGALIETEFFNADKLEDLTNLPSKADMIAGIIGSLGSPVSGIVGALDQATPVVRSLEAVTRDLISVIEAVAKKQNSAA